MNISQAQPNQIIPFGTYPHSAAGTDRSPIQWRVPQHSGDAVFLLSEYLIDCKRYHNQARETTWRDCDLRIWLNHEWLRTAFTTAEQECIRTTLCADNGVGSPDTEDKVFLLSVAQVKAFTDPKDDARRRRTIGTDYAKVKKPDGCSLYVYDKGVEQDYLVVDGERRGCSWWWTRTQLQIQDGHSARATFIGPRSTIKSYGKVDIKHYGVRPAIIVRGSA
jgi:hypothetical protein